MTTSMARIILPGEIFLYLLTISAIISVPPVLPPWEMEIPIPSPIIIPPIMVDISLPFWIARVLMTVSGMSPCKTLRPTDANTMAYIVFPPKLVPKIKKAVRSNTALITKKEYPILMPTAYWIMELIPVTPFPIRLFGVRKITQPNT